MKIKSKLALTFLPLALVTLLVLGAFAYFNAKQALTGQVLNHLESVAAKQEHQIESIVEQNRERLVLVSSRTQLRITLEKYLSEPKDSYREKMIRILNDAVASVPDFRSVSVIDLNNQVVASTDPTRIGTTYTDSEVLEAARNGDRVDLFYRDEHGQLSLHLAGPLNLHSRLLGVLVIDSDVSNIVASTTDYQGLGDTGETLLVRRNEDGDALFLTPARFDVDAALKRTLSRENTASPFIQALHKQEGLFTDVLDYTGQSVIAVSRYLDEVNWGLVVQMRRNEAYASIDTLSTLLASLIALFCVAVTGVSLYMARTISLPIARLTEVATRISGGDLSQRAKVNTSDEVGVLAQAFNQMTENLVRDINQRRQAEEKFQSLLKSAPDAIVIVETSGEICLVNLQAEKLFGYTNEELLGTSVELLLPARYRRGHAYILKSFAAKPRFRAMADDLELFGLRKDGTEFPVEITLAPIETSDGLLITSVIRDITERKQTEARLVKQANFDNLTGLPNRLLAADRLSQALAHAHRTRQSVAVMFLDIDRFKNVNDTLGHAVGDRLLIEVAKRLTDNVREDDTVARLGGDEFLLILRELESLSSAEIVAEEILESLSLPYLLNDRELFTTASIGLTGYPDDSDDPDVLLRNADSAMYQAKEAGRNTYRFFTPEMNIQLLRRLEMESHLRYAVSRDEMLLYFQPQMEVDSGELVGAEALLRWQNPVLGLVPPDEFIPLAEETGLIIGIGEWVLSQACQLASGWQSRIPTPIRLSVNISPLQFRGGDLVKTVSNALSESGLPASLLELEITERVLVEDNPNTSRILKDLKRMGIRLSLDDFGKGYSSLSYLKCFPFDVLKIDRAFIAGVTVDSEDAALCRAISAMASSLNLSVVAEGVETQQQWQFVCGQGTDLVQGYYISSPIEAEKFVDFLIANQGRLSDKAVRPDFHRHQ